MDNTLIWIIYTHNMPKWKKDETEFTVGVTYHETRGCQSYIPKPIIEMLGEPDSITFTIRGKNITLKVK